MTETDTTPQLRDFILVGEGRPALYWLAQQLQPKLTIVEQELWSYKRLFKKALQIGIPAMLVNARLRKEFDNHPLFENAGLLHHMPRKFVEKVKSKDVEGERVCIFGSSIIRKKTIRLSKEIVNLHLGYLPEVGGNKPEVSAIADGKKVGATVHWVTTVIDGGTILARCEIPVTARTIVDLKIDLLKAGVELIKQWYEGNVEEIENPRSGYYATPSWREVKKAERLLRERNP